MKGTSLARPGFMKFKSKQPHLSTFWLSKMHSCRSTKESHAPGIYSGVLLGDITIQLEVALHSLICFHKSLDGWQRGSGTRYRHNTVMAAISCHTLIRLKMNPHLPSAGGDVRNTGCAVTYTHSAGSAPRLPTASEQSASLSTAWIGAFEILERIIFSLHASTSSAQRANVACRLV